MENKDCLNKCIIHTKAHQIRCQRHFIPCKCQKRCLPHLGSKGSFRSSGHQSGHREQREHSQHLGHLAVTVRCWGSSSLPRGEHTSRTHPQIQMRRMNYVRGSTKLLSHLLGMHMCVTACLWMPGDNLLELVLPCLCVRNSDVRLGSKYPHHCAASQAHQYKCAFTDENRRGVWQC